MVWGKGGERRRVSRSHRVNQQPQSIHLDLIFSPRCPPASHNIAGKTWKLYVITRSRLVLYTFFTIFFFMSIYISYMICWAIPRHSRLPWTLMFCLHIITLFILMRNIMSSLAPLVKEHITSATVKGVITTQTTHAKTECTDSILARSFSHPVLWTPEKDAWLRLWHLPRK